MKYFSGILVAVLLSPAAIAQPAFQVVTSDPAIAHQYVGGWEHFVGGGAAAFDCDGDLMPELYLAGGESPSVLLRNTSDRGQDVSFVVDTPEVMAMTGVIGAYPLDMDSDGNIDIYVLRVGENKVLQGFGDCTFNVMDMPTATGGNKWSTAFSATWEGDNALPTLAIGNYVNRDDPEGPFEACDTSYLMRPAGSNYEAFPLTPGYCPLSMLFSDWGRNGRQDLRVSNDKHYYVRGGTEQIWAMEDKPHLYGPEDGWNDFSIWGMGIASRDISGDGVPEVFLTSMGDQKMQMLDTSKTGPAFMDATYERGTTAHRPHTGVDGRPSTGWHVEFADVNNDGLDDVFIAKGNVEQMLDSATADPNNLLMQSPDGRFSEAGALAGIATMDRSRGAALVDFNLDGLLDLVVNNRRAPVEIYQNITADAGNWLMLDVRQDGSNPQAVGAWIEINGGTGVQSREITVGGGHAGGSAALTHFGLGTLQAVTLRVIWPDGSTSENVTIESNQILRIMRSGKTLKVTPL